MKIKRSFRMLISMLTKVEEHFCLNKLKLEKGKKIKTIMLIEMALMKFKHRNLLVLNPLIQSDLVLPNL